MLVRIHIYKYIYIYMFNPNYVIMLLIIKTIPIKMILQMMQRGWAGLSRGGRSA